MNIVIEKPGLSLETDRQSLTIDSIKLELGVINDSISSSTLFYKRPMGDIIREEMSFDIRKG